MHTIATIVPHIDYLEPFTVVTCNNRPSHILPWAFHGSHSPSSGTGQSQDLSCTRFPCSEWQEGLLDEMEGFIERCPTVLQWNIIN